MLQQYKILTVTHRNTPLKQIGQFVIKSEHTADLRGQLGELRTAMQLTELLYVATCNRVIYLFTNDVALSSSFVSRFFAQVNPDLTPEQLSSVQIMTGEEAIAHFYEVAASVDSLVIGERQILGQLREAFEQCRQWDLTGDDLRLLFQHAVLAARDVYANTRIGDKPVSVVSLAVQKLLRLHVPTDVRILLVGAGQTNALAAKFLKKHHFERVTVFNRTVERAQLLANTFVHGRALPLTALQDYADGFDVMIVCTGATDPIITEATLPAVLNGEPAAGKIIIDLSVPHNVAADAVDAFAFTYVEIEDLRHLAQENMAFREQEMRRAQHLLEVHREEFPVVYRQRMLEIALRQVPVEIKAVRRRAIDEVFHKEVAELDQTTRDLLERMMGYMEKKCISIPMKAAREALI